MEVIKAGGLEIAVERKKIKNIYLRIPGKDGKIRLSAPYWVSDGQIMAFVESKLPWIEKRMAAFKPAEERIYSQAERRAFRALCRETLDFWEPVVGKKASTFTVRDMSSRWGSCNTKTGKLCFNLKLLDKPQKFLDYVVCHELCHLYVPGHGPDFWALMDRFYPDWRAVRRALREK